MEEHTFRYLIVFLIIGGFIGWLAGTIVKGRGYGIIADIAIGILGAILGGWIAQVLGLSINNSYSEFLMALIGAVVLVGVTRFVIRTV